MKKPLIGAHVSCAGGISRAIENGERIGAEAIQIFGLSPRQWASKLPASSEADNFKTAQKNSSIKDVYLHAAYLVNLASNDPIILERSKHSLTEHLKVAEMIGATGLVFHLGSAKGFINREEALEQEVRAMLEVINNVPGNSFLIMENSAGGGDKIGSSPEEVGYLYKKAKSKRIKVCFDTAHAFEAGLVKQYTKESVKLLFDSWDKNIGLDNLIVIHANDSKTVSGSNHDKHENIGLGHVGSKGFEALTEEKRLHSKPWILEVPGLDNEGPDKANIDILRKCFK